MNTFLGFTKPIIDDEEDSDDSRRQTRQCARPLPFLDTCGFAQHHDLLVMNLREDLTDSHDGGFDRHVVGFALATAFTICSYSIVDGYGSRINGSAPSFIMWEMFGNAVIMAITTSIVRGAAPYLALRTEWPAAMAGAAMSSFAYVIVAWAMTRAPIALVAALRETGVLFAAMIGVALLGERMTRWRWLAAAMIVCGVVLMRLA